MAPPVPPVAAVHGPYEDLAIEFIRLLEKLIDGQTPEQKAIIWKNWIDWWQPFFDLVKNP